MINIMKDTLLLSDYNKQESLISPSVVAILVNFKREPPDNTTCMSHEDTMSGNSS
jgi:hypothetical protein